MKNRKTLKSLLVMVLLVAIIAALQLIPAFANPGDANDPLVTQRYVDERIAALTAEIDQLRGIINNIAPGSVEAGGVVPFAPVNIPAGSTLIADAGAEFIVRSGTATAVSGADGMVNVTAGVDIINGMDIPANNLLLVPRSDGRGFFAETDTWIMIKGGFSIVG